MIVLIVLIALILIVWAAYSFTAAYQQTLTIEIPFENTYRYINHPIDNSANQHCNHDKLDITTNNEEEIISMKIIVTGSMKSENDMICPSNTIKQFIYDNVIIPHRNSIIAHESQLINNRKYDLKRVPIVKSPTLENLSILFFHKLAPIMSRMGCQLVSVTIKERDRKVTHARYKISNYSV